MPSPKQFIISSSTPEGIQSHVKAEAVLVLQGGGALGAYQAGVYQALHEAGMEPDWVIGTSIGAINGAIIAGNEPEKRLKNLNIFWEQVEQYNFSSYANWLPGFFNFFSSLNTYSHGIPGFFEPNPKSVLGPYAHMGPQEASYYKTDALVNTLEALVDFEYLNNRHTRLTLGAVEIDAGTLHYFDTYDPDLCLNEAHVMASGALPPGFPAIQVGDKFFWDGGVYSNTPIEAIFNEAKRRNSLIFAVDLWDPMGYVPETLLEVIGRLKDIQYASRAAKHLEHQKELQELRKIILKLSEQLPDDKKKDHTVCDLIKHGCSRTMHIVRLIAPHLDGEDYTKDIDFSAKNIRARRKAGYADTCMMLERTPWQDSVDQLDAVLIHDVSKLRQQQKEHESEDSVSA